MGWGTTARKGATESVRMGFEMDPANVHGGIGAMRLSSQIAENGNWVGGMNDVGDNGGEAMPFGGYIKLENAGSLQIGLVRFCGGGGYCELPDHWKTAFRSGGSTLGWQAFEYIVTMPSSSECDADIRGDGTGCGERGISGPNISIHMNFTGPGTAWVDDLYIGVTKIDFEKPLYFHQSYVADNRKVTFEAPANYVMKIVSPDGRLYRMEKGVSRTVNFFNGTPEAGTYIINVTSDRGTVTRTVTVSR